MRVRWSYQMQRSGTEYCIDENVSLSRRIYRHDSATDWLTFIPGAGAASAIWRRQVAAFSKGYNVLVIDLPGHGRSTKPAPNASYTFDSVAQQIVAVMDSEQVSSSHFVAMSLGCLIVEAIALREPERVKSMVLAGGVTKLNTWATCLIWFGNLTKMWIPYLWLYRIFAWTIMPGPHHFRTRHLFYAHAKRLSKNEFLRWYNLTDEVQLLMTRSAGRSSFIPTLFIMGTADYMFGHYVVQRARTRRDTSVAFVRNCGHVCPVESSHEFNKITQDFLNKLDLSRDRTPA